MQRWITKLLEICEAKFPAVTHLEAEFPVLAAVDFHDMELPGQFQQTEFNPDGVIYVERVSSNVLALRRHCVSLRRLELIGSDGRSRYFALHSGQNQGTPGSTEQRMMMAFRCAPLAVHAPLR